MIRSFFTYYLLALTLMSCGQKDETFDEMVQRMASDQVAIIYPEDIPDGAILVDRREPEELEVSMIPGAISDIDFEKKVERGELEPTTPVVVYCSVGYRSGLYGKDLQDQGFAEVYNLYGGIFHWVNSGRGVENVRGVTDSVHTYNKKWSQWLEKGIKTW